MILLKKSLIGISYGIIIGFFFQNAFAGMMFKNLSWHDSSSAPDDTYNIIVEVFGATGTVYRCSAYGAADNGQETFFYNSSGHKFIDGSSTSCYNTGTSSPTCKACPFGISCTQSSMFGSFKPSQTLNNFQLTTSSGTDDSTPCTVGETFQIRITCDFVYPFSSSLTTEVLEFEHTCPFG